jgi:multiple sugar transport system permease protein
LRLQRERRPVGAHPRSRSTLARREAVAALPFLLPWTIGFVAFVAGPMLASLYLSLTEYGIVKPPIFVGAANFTRALFRDSLFWPSLLRTFEYAAIVVPFGVGGALLVALLLNQGLRLTSVYRTIFFLPHLTPAVASIFIWKWLLSPQFGVVNETLRRVFNVSGPGWFGSKEWALPSLALVALWAIVGGNMMLIFLAGLQAVPRELHEAAAIDGANRWSRFWRITLPTISPTLFFNSILAVIAALQTFTGAFVATQGGPAYATWFYALHIYATAFQFTEMGYASALAWLFFLVLVAFTYLQFRASTRWVYYAGENG